MTCFLICVTLVTLLLTTLDIQLWLLCSFIHGWFSQSTRISHRTYIITGFYSWKTLNYYLSSHQRIYIQLWILLPSHRFLNYRQSIIHYIVIFSFENPNIINDLGHCHQTSPLSLQKGFTHIQELNGTHTNQIKPIKIIKTIKNVILDLGFSPKIHPSMRDFFRWRLQIHPYPRDFPQNSPLIRGLFPKFTPRRGTFLNPSLKGE